MRASQKFSLARLRSMERIQAKRDERAQVQRDKLFEKLAEIERKRAASGRRPLPIDKQIQRRFGGRSKTPW